jgi:hypothetical protein
LSGKLTSGWVAITTTPTRINGISVNPIQLTIQNIDTTDTAYLGAENVTITSGVPLEKGETFTITLYQGNTLWGIGSKVGHNIAYIAQEL